MWYTYLIQFWGFNTTGQRWGKRIFPSLSHIKDGVIFHLQFKHKAVRAVTKRNTDTMIVHCIRFLFWSLYLRFFTQISLITSNTQLTAPLNKNELTTEKVHTVYWIGYTATKSKEERGKSQLFNVVTITTNGRCAFPIPNIKSWFLWPWLLNYLQPVLF